MKKWHAYLTLIPGVGVGWYLDKQVGIVEPTIYWIIGFMTMFFGAVIIVVGKK
jgi:hypothetical protein